MVRGKAFMKKILIVSHAMELGGVERALLGLLEAFDYERYSVDLFLLRHKGELLKYIPNKVKLLPESSSYSCLAAPIKEVLKKGHFNIAFARWKGKRAAQKRIKELYPDVENDIMFEYSHKYTLDAMPMISDKGYDAVISFLIPHYFAANKVNADKKIAWIHTDYNSLKVDKVSQLPMWEAYSHVISISKAVGESFLKVFPELGDRITYMANILPTDMIKSQADELDVKDEMPENEEKGGKAELDVKGEMPENGEKGGKAELDVKSEMPEIEGELRLLSIGRFAYAKNFDNVPDICSRLRQMGLNVKWYLIGFGQEEGLIREKIKESGMEEYVIILGKKENPYPYIKACDIYVQPSRYEGNSISVREAQVLSRPVVISDYLTSKSQLADGRDGIILPLDNEKFARGLYKIANDNKLINRLVSNCGNNDYSGREEIEKLYEIIG